MVAIEIPYGGGKQIAHIPQGRLNAVLAPRHTAPSGEAQEEIVRRALASPIGSPALCELAKGKRRVLIITSDHTRPVPSRITMPQLLAGVRAGNPQAEITILIATGMHRPTTQAELLDRFDGEIVAQERIVVHRAQADEDMAFFGTLPSGGELWLNRLVK